MFGWYYCWRLKRRQHSLALAWCSDPATAAWLVRESRASAPCLNRLDVYRRMAVCWLRYLEECSSPAERRRIPTPAASDPAATSVRELIAAMPMQQRMTLSLIDIARLSYRDTAAIMNIGMFDVQYQIVAARRQLLDQLRAIHGKSVCEAHGGTLNTC